MEQLDELRRKEDEIYHDCTMFNNCTECIHNNGNGHRDCNLTLVSRKIDELLKNNKSG